MRLLKGNMLAVFWTRKGWKKQFQADVPGVATPQGVKDAVAYFREMFPDNIVCSVRDHKGRFLKFK